MLSPVGARGCNRERTTRSSECDVSAAARRAYGHRRTQGLCARFDLRNLRRSNHRRWDDAAQESDRGNDHQRDADHYHRPVSPGRSELASRRDQGDDRLHHRPPPVSSGEPVLLPGDPERLARSERMATRSTTRPTWREIVEAAGSLGVPVAGQAYAGGEISRLRIESGIFCRCALLNRELKVRPDLHEWDLRISPLLRGICLPRRRRRSRR
jgi:hypothetical protein